MTAGVAVDSSSDEPPLLEAKLAKPRLRAGVIRRPRLFDVLDRLESRELTVISGPAGSGKTVLVSSWLAARPDLATAWITLDASGTPSSERRCLSVGLRSPSCSKQQGPE